MDKVRKQWSRLKNKSEATQDSGDEVSLQSPKPSPDLGKSPKRSKKKNSSSESSPLTSQSSFTTTNFGESKEKPGTSLKDDDVFQFPITDIKEEPKFPGHGPKANTWGGSRNAEGSLSSSSGSSLSGSSPLNSGVQKPQMRLASNSKEDQAKRQAYRPSPQHKALQVELEQVKKERDEAKQELADEKDRNVKLEQDHRENRGKLWEVSKEYSELKRQVFDLRLKIQQCKCGKTPQASSNNSLPECDEGVNYRSLPESNAGEGSGEVGQQCRSYQSFEAVSISTPDRSRVDTLMKLHLEEKLKKKDLDIVQLKQTIRDLEQKLETCEESTCDLARPRESDQLESLREQVKAVENTAQQKEETIAQLTKECAELKEELEQQETKHDLQVLTAQENLTQALKTNEALNLEVQQLRTSQSEQVELRVKLMKQHASDLDVKQREIDALKREKGILMSKERKLSTSHVLHGESDGRSVDELMAEKQGQIDSFEKEKVDLLEQLKESVTKEDLMVRIRQELTEKKQEVEKLQLQLKEEKEALKAERRKLNEKQEKIDALKLQLNEEKEELEAVIRQRNEKQQENDALKGEKQVLVENAQSESIDSQQKLQEEMEEEKALISLQKQLKDLQMKHVAQVSMLEEKLFALQKEKEEVETNDKDFSEEIAKMNKQIEDLWKQIESLQAEKRTLESEKQSFLDSLSRERESEKRQAEQLQTLKGKLREKETAEAEGKQVLIKKEREIQSLQAEKRTLESEKQKLLSEQRESEKRQADELEFLEGKLREKETVEAEGKQVIDSICTDNEKKEKQIQSLQAQVSNWPGQIAIVKESANKEKIKLSKELNTAKKELDTARQELDASKVEIDARIQHEVKITRELRATVEEKSRLQDQLQTVQFQLESYKADFDQERKDRASAAGRYVEEEEQLKKALQDLSAKLGKKVLEIDELKEKLEREKVERVAEAANHSDQAKDYQRKIREVRIARDETQAKLVQLREVSVTNKKEAEIFKNRFEHSKQMEQQLRAQIEQLQKDNAKSSHDITSKNNKWFLKSNRRLSQSDDHGRRGGHRGGRYGGGHGKQDEDSEMTMAALLSEKTFWEDQCKQQEEDFEYEREHSRQLEQQLKEENRKLKQEYAHVVKGAQTGVNREAHGRYGDQHGGEDDVDMIIATLRSENSHLEEQNKQLKKDYEHQHQVLSQQYRHSQSTVEDLKVEIRELHDRLNRQAVSPRGPVDPLYPSEQDIKVPPGHTNRGDLTERDNHYRRQPGQHPHLNPGSDSGYSDASRQDCDCRTPKSPSVRSPNMSPQVDRKHSREGRIDEFVTNDAHFDNTPNYDGQIKDMPIDNTSHDDTSTFDLERSAGLPAPLHRSVQMSLSSDSDTSFQPNRRYIGDGINREIKQQAKHYKQGVQRGLPVADEVDEELWPYDPNLVCPHCGKRFRHGQIREFRYHIDDEHSPSMV